MWSVFTFLLLLIGPYLSAQTSYKLEVGINHATLTSIKAYGNKPFLDLALSSPINRQTIFSHSFLYLIKGYGFENHHYLTWVTQVCI